MVTTALAPPLPLDPDGYEVGTAAMLVPYLTTPDRMITEGRIRDWARRSRNPHDPLHGMLPAIHVSGPRTGTTWYRLLDAARVAAVTRRDQVRC